MNISLVYLAAGMSRRFGGNPKQFVKVGLNDETLIEYSLNQALTCDFKQIHFIVGEKTEHVFKSMFKDKYKNIPVTYSLQTYDKNIRSKPWGTADALTTIKGYVKNSFIVCNSDDIYGEETFHKCFTYLQENPDINVAMGFILGDTLPENGTVNRGIFQTDKENIVTSLIENLDIQKTDFTKDELDHTLISSNFFGFNPKIIDMLYEKNIEFIKNNIDNSQIECLLPSFVNEFIKTNSITLKLLPTSSNPKDNIVCVLRPKEAKEIAVLAPPPP